MSVCYLVKYFASFDSQQQMIHFCATRNCLLLKC